MMQGSKVDSHLGDLTMMDMRVAALENSFGSSTQVFNDTWWLHNDNVDLHVVQIEGLHNRITALENSFANGFQTNNPDPDDTNADPDGPDPDTSGPLPGPGDPGYVDPNPPGNFHPDTGENYFNLTNATIIDQSTPGWSNATSLFDSPGDPYFKGTSMRSEWQVDNVTQPYVIIDTLSAIQVKSIHFYKSGPGHSINFPLMKQFPQSFMVYTGVSSIGPWILVGGAQYMSSYPPVTEVKQDVDLYENTTSQFWKITVSGQEATRMVLTEAVFMRS
jgi:hypothetical protein